MINYQVAGESPLDNKILLKLAEAVSEKLVVKKLSNIGISFVDSAEIKKLNKKYSGDDYATDVLSFHYEDNPDVLGDIAICTELASKQASEHGISLESELVLLLLHGSLHLLGYDHQDEQGVASMDKLQSDIMEALKYNYRDFKWFH